ncbi:MAG: hypothetical protein ACOYN6_07980 [Ignavibacteria bacterium]
MFTKPTKSKMINKKGKCIESTKREKDLGERVFEMMKANPDIYHLLPNAPFMDADDSECVRYDIYEPTYTHLIETNSPYFDRLLSDVDNNICNLKSVDREIAKLKELIDIKIEELNKIIINDINCFSESDTIKRYLLANADEEVVGRFIDLMFSNYDAVSKERFSRRQASKNVKKIEKLGISISSEESHYLSTMYLGYNDRLNYIYALRISLMIAKAKKEYQKGVKNYIFDDYYFNLIDILIIKFSRGLATLQEQILYLIQAEEKLRQAGKYSKEIETEKMRIENVLRYEKGIDNLSASNNIPAPKKNIIEQSRPDTKAKYRIEWKLSDSEIRRLLKILNDGNVIKNYTSSNFKSIAGDCFIRANGNDFYSNKSKLDKTMRFKCFSKTIAIHRIDWNLEPTDIIDFFIILEREGIISEGTKDRYKVIARDCFAKKDGSDFNNDKLGNLQHQKIKGESKNSFKIHKALDIFKIK